MDDAGANLRAPSSGYRRRAISLVMRAVGLGLAGMAMVLPTATGSGMGITERIYYAQTDPLVLVFPGLILCAMLVPWLGRLLDIAAFIAGAVASGYLLIGLTRAQQKIDALSGTGEDEAMEFVSAAITIEAGTWLLFAATLVSLFQSIRKG